MVACNEVLNILMSMCEKYLTIMEAENDEGAKREESGDLCPSIND